MNPPERAGFLLGNQVSQIIISGVSDRTVGIRLKIKRAIQHVEEFQTELGRFDSTHPYVISSKRDPNTRQLIYYVSEAKPLVPELVLLAGEVISDFRTALEYAAFELAGCPSGKGSQNVGFPIFESAEKYKAGLAAKVQGMPQAAIDLIDSAKPYKGGNDPLWILHELNNRSKHRFLLTAASALQDFNLGKHVWANRLPESFMHGVPDFYVRPVDNIFPVKEGCELFRDAPDAKENKNVEFRFVISFNEPGVCEGEPIIETINTIGLVVVGLINEMIRLLP